MCNPGLNIGKDKPALTNILKSAGKLNYGLSIRLYDNKLKLKVKIINCIKQAIKWTIYYDFVLVKKYNIYVHRERSGRICTKMLTFGGQKCEILNFFLNFCNIHILLL